jgi:hypothetical protein
VARREIPDRRVTKSLNQSEKKEKKKSITSSIKLPKASLRIHLPHRRMYFRMALQRNP